MNKEHWKAMLPIITAFCEGKTIQKKTSIGDNGWADQVPDFLFDCSPDAYRIKPEPKLRPWRPEEVPVGAVVRPKGDQIIRVTILAVDVREVEIAGFTGRFKFKQVLNEFELLDGSPCGVLEVSE